MLDQRYFALYHETVTAAAQVEEAVNRSLTPDQILQLEGDYLANLTDNIYATRETYNLLDNLRKKVARLHKELQQVACVAYMEATPSQQLNLTDTGAVVGEYASGKPKTKTTVESLKRVKCPELYDRFCREVLGVTNESLIESGAIEVHYKYFGEWVTARNAEGSVLPEVMAELKTYNEFEFGVTKRRALLS